MAFRAEERKIDYMFSSEKIYNIPPFQRKYVWEKKQWTQLIEDLILAINNNEKHFLGTCVIEETKTGLNIIDGQQRLTTFFILLSCMYIYLNDSICCIEEHLKQDMKEYIKNMLICRTGLAPKRPRITTKYTIINKLVESIDDGNATSNTLNELLKDVESEEEVINAYKFFIGFIFDKKISKEQLDFEFVKLYEWIISCKIIEVISSNSSDAYSVFEILNARGIQLTQLQLLKSYMYKHLRISKKIVTVYSRWGELENHLTDVDGDTFLFHSLKCIGGYKKPKIKTTYECIVKSHKNYSEKQQFTFLETLIKFAKKYKNYEKTDLVSNSPFNQLISFCSIKGIKVYRPLILAIDMKSDLLSDKLDYVYNILYKFVVLNNIRKTYSNKLDDAISELSNRIIRSDDSLEIIKLFLTFIYNHKHLVDKNDCINDIRAIQYSNKAASDNNSSKFIIMLLKKIYNKAQTNTDLPIDYSLISVEHILNDSEFEKSKMNLGNLLLITKNMNEQLKNLSYLEKKAIYKTSSIEYVKEFENSYENFTITDSINRTAKLAEDIYNCFELRFNEVNDEIIKITKIMEINKTGIINASYLADVCFSDFKEKILLRQDISDKEKENLVLMISN